jgi:signal transduction histidine kinase/ActR/RegA family two-component response regulator
MFIPPFRFRPQFAATFTSIYFTGVFAGNGTMVGVVASPIRWILLIIGGVPEEQLANAIFSISTPLSTFTAQVIDGEAVEVHDLHHTNYEKEMSLSSESDDVQYTLRLYPSPEFYDKRHTLLPLIITIVTGLVIFLLLSLVLLNASYLTMQLERDTTQKLVDSKAKFIRVISHELRTPLQSLRLGLELLGSEVTPTTPNFRAVDVSAMTDIQEDLAGNVDMAVKTLDDLLEYDKLRSGKTTLNEEVTLLPILLEVLAPFKRLAERRQIKVSLVMDTHVHSEASNKKDSGSNIKNLRVRADSERLRRVFYHIMANTLKCIPDGAVITILLSWRCSGDAFCATHQLGTGKHLFPTELQDQSIMVCFETSGDAVAGIDQNFLLRPDLPFDPDMLQVGQGSGLGLCISKLIVEDHGGAMWMTAAEDNTGSSIKVELPLVETGIKIAKHSLIRVIPMQNSSLLANLGKTEETRMENGQRSSNIREEITLYCPPDCNSSVGTIETDEISVLKKVLIVDDSPPIRRLLHRVLTKRGAIVEVACHGKEAVDVISASGHEYGCILMDFEMPVMNGPDATKKIREIGFDSLSLAIVGVTGNTNTEDIEHFKSCGADSVYSKPVSVDVLSKILIAAHCVEKEASKKLN